MLTNVSPDQKEFDLLSDSEQMFTKPEIEELTDTVLKCVVQSDYFDIMDQQERIATIYFLQFCKQAMYRNYF